MAAASLGQISSKKDLGIHIDQLHLVLTATVFKGNFEINSFLQDERDVK